MIYQKESYINVIEEIAPLLPDHYDEAILYSDHMPLNPNYHAYSMLDKMGRCIIFTARQQDELVGYIVTIADINPYSMDYESARAQMIYLKEEFRHTDVAPDFIKAYEQEMRNLDFDVIDFHFPVHNKCEALMDHLEYDKADVSYSKYIGKKDG